jgi:hypothetical protein
MRHSGTFLMPCIFGFEFHDWFCPCELLYVRPSELGRLICSDCKYQLKTDYETFLNDKKESWNGDLEDFLAVHIDERLKKLRVMYPELCKSKLNIKQYEVVDRKLGMMYDNFISTEDVRIEAKIESGEISVEDLAAV